MAGWGCCLALDEVGHLAAVVQNTDAPGHDDPELIALGVLLPERRADVERLERAEVNELHDVHAVHRARVKHAENPHAALDLLEEETERDHARRLVRRARVHHQRSARPARGRGALGSLRALLVCSALQLFQQFCGVNAIVYFTPQILKQAGQS